MSYRREQIRPYLDDHAAVTKRATSKYVCPLTLEACELHEISRGHIINEKIPYGYNRIVPVKKDHADSFYGTRVEKSFIHFATRSGMSAVELLRDRTEFNVKFRDDGPTYKAFLIQDAEVAEKRKHLPVISIERDGESLFIGLKDSKVDDPEVVAAQSAKHADVSFRDNYLPAHWVASMLKVGHLTMFYIFGYKAVYDPSGDVLRRVIVRYFYDGATRDNAPDYFRQFDNAVKVIGNGTTFNPDTYVPTDIDTLRDLNFLAHMNAKRLFAITLLYKLADKTISVTVPQMMDGADIASATRWYDMLMAQNPELTQTVHVAQFDGKKFDVGPEIGAHYQAEFESLEINR